MSIDGYELLCQPDGLPDLIAEYKQHAALAEEFAAPDEADGPWCFVAVGPPLQWPSLVVTQRYAPAGCGFHPGALLVPETHRLFIGAGHRLLAYDLSAPARLWEDQADCGFWAWSRHGQVVLMSAELELAAWNVMGHKLWSQYVEPPWGFKVEGEVVELDVMGTESRLHLLTGKACGPTRR